jgi:RPE1 domain-containing protein
LKLACARECTRDPERKTRVYTKIHEDLSAASTYKLPSQVEFQEESNVMNAHGFACFRTLLDHRNKQWYAESLKISTSSMSILSDQEFIYFYDEDDDSLIKHFSSREQLYSLRIAGNEALGFHKCAEDYTILNT